MNGTIFNPYALYVCCDGAMNYDSKNTGGVGIEIVFPEAIGLESIKISLGKYERANIERLELEAILQGMKEVIRLFENDTDKLRNIKNIIFTTDRLSLNDGEKTSPYRIREWRKNNWHNHEGKAIKNSDLLDKRQRGTAFKNSGHYKSFTLSELTFENSKPEFKELKTQTTIFQNTPEFDFGF